MSKRMAVPRMVRAFYYKGLRIVFHAIRVSTVVLFIILPLAWLFISSIASPKDLLAVPPRWLPWPPDFSNYHQLLFGTEVKGTTLTSLTLRAFRFSLRNSLLVASGVTLLCLTLGVLAGYAFARLRMPFGDR
ncbi:MAG: hypothetical protein ACK4OK_10300, partial [Thermoflexus sp.]